jgi:hypothetical protein
VAPGGQVLADEDPVAAGAGRAAGGAGRDPGGDGGHQRLLQEPVLAAGRPGVRDVAGECQGCQASAGRPKTDRLDAVWLAKLAERQVLRPGFVPPPPIRRLRDLTRYRADLVAGRTAEQQRAEKLLEDAQIKRWVVASDSFGVSGRAMLAALVARGARPQGAGPHGAHPPACQDRPAAGGLPWPLQRPSRLPAANHAVPPRPGQRRYGRGGGQDRGRDRPVRPGGRPAG